MKAQIINPCQENWNNFDPVHDQIRFCQVCATKVHDVTQMDEAAIHQLYLNHSEKLCIKAHKSQLKNATPKQYWWKKIGIAGLLVLSSLFSQDLFGQVVEYKTKAYKLKQEAGTENFVTIEGIVRLERLEKKWKRGGRVNVIIYTDEGLEIKRVKTKWDGRFSIRLPKDLLGQEFSIKAQSNHKGSNRTGYSDVNVNRLNTSDTFIEFYMETNKYFLGCPRF